MQMRPSECGICIPGSVHLLCSRLPQMPFTIVISWRQWATVKAQEGKRKRHNISVSDTCGLTKSFSCTAKGILSKDRISKFRFFFLSYHDSCCLIPQLLFHFPGVMEPAFSYVSGYSVDILLLQMIVITSGRDSYFFFIVCHIYKEK